MELLLNMCFWMFGFGIGVAISSYFMSKCSDKSQD